MQAPGSPTPDRVAVGSVFPDLAAGSDFPLPGRDHRADRVGQVVVVPQQPAVLDVRGDHLRRDPPDSRCYSDLTTEDAETGNVWFWEHLGMKRDAEHDRK